MASDEHKPTDGIVHAGFKLGSQVAASLAPQFLSLLLLNVAVMFLLFWFVDGRARHTAAIIDQLMKSCLHQQ